MPDREKVIAGLEKALAISEAVDSGFIWITVGEAKQALELLEGQRWISVKDKMPNDFKPVFVWIGVGSSIRSGVPFVGKYNMFNGEWLVFGLNADMKEIIKITHWMPLLEPPKEE